jgi:hypothetical protein
MRGIGLDTLEEWRGSLMIMKEEEREGNIQL